MKPRLLLRLAPISSRRWLHSTTARWGKAPPELLRLSALGSDAEHKLAREWLDGFRPGDIPPTAIEKSFARSSGPGGQHVNKTMSKAIVRCRLSADWAPPFLLEHLRRSNLYLPDPPALLVASQESRSAPQNQAAALDNLYRAIVEAGRAAIRGETSADQRRRVQGLEKAHRASVRRDKERRGAKKALRRAE